MAYGFSVSNLHILKGLPKVFVWKNLSMQFLFKNYKIKQRNKRKLCRVGLPAALQLCPPGSWLAASHSHVGCGSFCLPQLCSGEDEEVLGQAFTHLLGFHPHSHCISTLTVALLPLPLWHCPLAVLDTLCCLRGCRWLPSSPVPLHPQEAGSPGRFISVGLFF